MRYFLSILIFFVFAFGYVNRLFYKRNDSFNINEIILNWDSLTTFSSPLSDDLISVLNQPFSYLAKGNQFFAFLSSDGKWVIKFPRLLRHCSHSQLLKSLHLCATDLAQETAIVYSHLEKSATRLNLNLVDLLGHLHQVSLDQVPFILQRAGQPFFEALDQSESPKRLIAAAVGVYRSLHQKGYSNQDPIFHKNFGWCEGRPFILDIGNITSLEDSDSLEKVTVSLRDRLAEKMPELLPFYRDCLR